MLGAAPVFGHVLYITNAVKVGSNITIIRCSSIDKKIIIKRKLVNKLLTANQLLIKFGTFKCGVLYLEVWGKF